MTRAAVIIAACALVVALAWAVGHFLNGAVT